MNISIKYLQSCCPRPWLVKRENGTYEQHAHMRTKKDALMVRRLIDAGNYPYSKEYEVAMRRLLYKDEFNCLNKKPQYHNSNRSSTRSRIK